MQLIQFMILVLLDIPFKAFQERFWQGPRNSEMPDDTGEGPIFRGIVRISCIDCRQSLTQLAQRFLAAYPWSTASSATRQKA